MNEREQLEDLLRRLEQQLLILDQKEPEDMECEAYEQWAEEHEDLEDQIDDIKDRLDDLF